MSWRAAIRDLYPGRIALVSSFGAEAAVLLHLVAAGGYGNAGAVHRYRKAVR